MRMRWGSPSNANRAGHDPAPSNAKRAGHDPAPSNAKRAGHPAVADLHTRPKKNDQGRTHPHTGGAMTAGPCQTSLWRGGFKDSAHRCLAKAAR